MQANVNMVHVIDDDDAVRESLEALLLVSGFGVETYRSAEEYLRRGNGGDGCLVLDIHMPGMSGLDLLEGLARRERRVPILVLTASREAWLAERALELGAFTVLTKPVPGPTLIEAIRAAGATDTRNPSS